MSHEEPTSPPVGPPFWRLLVIDFHGLLNHAMVIALAIWLAGLPGLARHWISDLFEEMGQAIPITAVLDLDATEEQREALRTALGENERVIGLQEFTPESARERLAAAGVEVDELDPFAFQDQPWGVTFRWRGLATGVGDLMTAVHGLESEMGVEVHWDRDRARQLHTDALRARQFLTRLHWTMAAVVMLALAPGALLLGRPRLGVPLSTGEMAQALAVRAFAAAVVGWLVAATLLRLTGGLVGAERWEGAWMDMMWVLIATPLVSPAGLLRRSDG